MYFLYNLILIFLVFFTFPFWGIKIIFSSRWRKGIGERFGFLSLKTKESIKEENEYFWVHASSVGEVKIASALIKEIKKKFPYYNLLISSMTPAGVQILKNLYPDEIVIFVPLDLRGCIKRILKCFRIKILILVETEIWPNLVRLVKKQQATIIVVNGRISDKSFKKYRIFRLWVKKVLFFIDVFSMQSAKYAERIIFLGAEKKKVKITGNIKYDGVLSEQIINQKNENIYREFSLSEKDLIWVAGSTRAGEERIIIDVYKQVLKKYSGLKLIIAPRHLERVAYLESLLIKEPFNFIKKSSLHSKVNSSKNGQRFPPPINVIVLDTMGELIKAYSIATVVFVGGSLVKIGGHNILEPASLGKPVLFGPYMQNFKEPASLLKEREGAIQVKDEKELETYVLYLLTNFSLLSKMGKNAGKAVLTGQGAALKNLELIAGLLQQNSGE